MLDNLATFSHTHGRRVLLSRRSAQRSLPNSQFTPKRAQHESSTCIDRAALRDLLGEDASGLSSSSIQRLTEAWQAEHAAFRTRELRFHRYAYLFVDGVNVSVRLGEDPKLCLLVVIGVERTARRSCSRSRTATARAKTRGGRVPRSARSRAQRAEARDRRRRARRVGRAAQRVPRRQRATLLGPQDSERPRRTPEAAAATGQDAAASGICGPSRTQRSRALPRRPHTRYIAALAPPVSAIESRRGWGWAPPFCSAAGLP